MSDLTQFTKSVPRGQDYGDETLSDAWRTRMAAVPSLTTETAVGTTHIPYLRARSGRSRTSIRTSRQPLSVSSRSTWRQSVQEGA